VCRPKVKPLEPQDPLAIVRVEQENPGVTYDPLRNPSHLQCIDRGSTCGGLLLQGARVHRQTTRLHRRALLEIRRYQVRSVRRCLRAMSGGHRHDLHHLVQGEGRELRSS
jgi:hypothetical protein